MSVAEQDWRSLDLTSASRQTVITTFETSVMKHASSPAVMTDAGSVSYTSLNIAANRLAHCLMVGAGRPNDRVAVMMNHGADLISAVVGSLKAARIVVVLNVTEPVERLRSVLNDAAPTVLAIDSASENLANALKPMGCDIVNVEDATRQGDVDSPGLIVQPDDVAFLVYTSGSMGRPRGVMMSHRYAIHNVRKHADSMDVSAGDRIALVAALSSSVGVTASNVALLNGACLLPYPVAAKGVACLADWVTEHDVSVFVSTTSLFRHFVRTLSEGQQFPRMRAVKITSESATSEDFAAFRKHFSDRCVFVHNFGSTETGSMAYVRLRRSDTVPGGCLPLGQVAEGINLSLIADDGKAVGPGEVGEVVVRSRGISPGYWIKEADVDGRFFREEPFDGVLGYRTGDLARFNASGLLEFVGRKDSRLKVRGNRFEPAEVEGALRRLAGVADAVCLGVQRNIGEHDLVAFVVMRPGEVSSDRELRHALLPALPGFMLPRTFVFLDSIPLTAHSKVDRERLLQRLPPRRAAPPEPPQTPTEIELAKLWETIFELPGIGRHDDFFELGGDSLDATELAAGLEGKLGVELRLETLTMHPTVAQLAAAVDVCRLQRGSEDAPPIVRQPRDRPLPMTYTQRRSFEDSQVATTAPRYTVARECRIDGPLDVELLRTCMTAMVRRYEILRTTFGLVDGRHAQIVHPPMPVDLAYHDLSDREDADAQAERIFRAESACVFDSAKLPLLRFVLVRTGEGKHRLLRVNHHIILDSGSWSIYFRELGERYEASSYGNGLAVDAVPTIQCGDYAAWQQRALSPDSPNRKAVLAWWQAQFADQPRSMALPFRRGSGSHSPSDGVIEWSISRDTSQLFDELARLSHATFFSVNLAVFAALMAAETKRGEVLVGTNYSHRNRAELRNVLGGLADLTALRLTCDDALTFRQWLARVRDRVIQTEAYAKMPYVPLQKELHAMGVKLPELTCLFLQEGVPPKNRFGGLELTWADRRTEVMPWGFAIECESRATGYCFHARFNAGLYRPSDVRRFIDRYRRLLDAIARGPGMTIGDLLSASRERTWMGRLRQTFTGPP